MIQKVWLVVFLVVTWCILTDSIALSNLVFAFALAYVVALFLGEPQSNCKIKLSGFQMIKLFFVLLKEIALSTWQVTTLICTKKIKLNSEFIEYDVILRRDGQLALLAQLITLTPGTLSVFATDDNEKLVIHALKADDPAEIVESIKNEFEGMISKTISYEKNHKN